MMRHNFFSPFHNPESQVEFPCPWYTLEIVFENQVELYIQSPGEENRDVKTIPAWFRGTMFKKTDNRLDFFFFISHSAPSTIS